MKHLLTFAFLAVSPFLFAACSNPNTNSGAASTSKTESFQPNQAGSSAQTNQSSPSPTSSLDKVQSDEQLLDILENLEEDSFEDDFSELEKQLR
ncbi:MAG: hypothetical protein ACOX6N_02730 [Patescibacteria group bacterium]|jgi:uncharacterized lipoprotein YajG